MFHLGLAAHVCSPYTALIDWNVWLNGSGRGRGEWLGGRSSCGLQTLKLKWRKDEQNYYFCRNGVVALNVLFYFYFFFKNGENPVN